MGFIWLGRLTPRLHFKVWPTGLTGINKNENMQNLIAPFQKSLDSGKLPRIWKEANAPPFFWDGDKSHPANYRPISLTCVLWKVLEHIVTSNLTKHLANSNKLFELQHRFREKRSCETQLVMRTRVITAVGRFGRVDSAWVVSSKFWGESFWPILVGRAAVSRFGRGSFWSRGYSHFFAYIGLDPASSVYPIKYQAPKKKNPKMYRMTPPISPIM